MIQGGLFVRDFLLEGVRAEPAWQAWSAEAVAAAKTRLGTLLAPVMRQHTSSEAETEQQFVFPVLEQVLD